MHKWSLVSVKPRSTSRLCSARFIFYSRDQNLRALGCVQTDAATLLAYNSQHCWELLRPFARSLNVRSQKRISGNQP